METKNTKVGTLLIIVAACFWGCMGIFVRKLTAYGFNPIQIVSIRVTLATVFFFAVLLFKDRKGFRLALRDIPLFLGLGLGSVLLFTVCYFSAISIMPLSTAAILLYTSPIWIMLMSAVFFKEKMAKRKLIALALAFAGCVLVSGISGEGITLTGLLLGLGSGIGYGLYSILGTVALRKYSPYTVTAYTFLIAGIGSLFIADPKDMSDKYIASSDHVWLIVLFILTALITAVIPFLSYTLGLRSVEAGKAGIIATIEPLVATLVGIFFFCESLTVMSAAGIVLILCAVVILNLGSNK
jgi:drug/metabolite transporter (DMT)-like permease